MDQVEGGSSHEAEMPLFQWFVMYCDDDDSHTLVPDEDVVYDRDSLGALLPGVEAYFFESGKKWRGVVKDMGNDYNTLVKSRDRMNANKPKRDLSFNANEPRRAKLKCNEALGVRSTSVKSSSASTSSKTSTQVERSVLKDRVLTSNDPGTSSGGQRSEPKSSLKVQQPILSERQSSVTKSKGESGIVGSEGKKRKMLTWDSDSSDDSLTDEQLQILAKLSERKRRSDMKDLANLAVKVPAKSDSTKHNKAEDSPVKFKKSTLAVNCLSDSESDSELPTHSKAVPQSFMLSETSSSDKSKTVEKSKVADETEASQKPKTADNISTDEGDSSDNDRPTSPIVLKKRSKPRSNFVNPKLQFTGEFYLHKETDPNVVQLHEDHKVFVPERIIKEVKRDSSINSTTALTRYIVRKVFTQEALQQCSVYGRPSACKGREAMTCRPALDPEGVQAIIKFVLLRAEKKKWKGAMKSTVSAAMANVICEGRDLQKLTAKK